MKKLGPFNFNTPEPLIVGQIDITTVSQSKNDYASATDIMPNRQYASPPNNNTLDPIDSIALIDNIKLIDCSINKYNDIATGSIMLELKRLLIRCFRADNYTIVGLWDNDIISNPAIYTIECCVSNIITNRKDDANFLSNMIKYNINVLFDFYKIRQIKEKDKIEEFIDYFIETFTSQK